MHTITRIDLGATFSFVATYKNGHVKITPPWVAFTDGEAVKDLRLGIRKNSIRGLDPGEVFSYDA